MRRFAEIDSTNAYLLGRAGAGAAEGLVAVADAQRAGRGRLLRTWQAPPGTSLLVSVLLRPALPVPRLQLAVACMALATVEACADVAGVRPGIKWPNDLVLGAGDEKLGGILAEADLPAVVVGLGPDVEQAAVVVGLGLNVDWPAGTLPAGAAALGPVDRDVLLDALLGHLGSLYGDWPRVAEEYRAACVTVGRSVRVELADGMLTGTAVGVTGEGHLLVDHGEGDATSRRTVTAGDVVHLRPDLPN